jgi:hypothetical protein
LTAWLQKDDTNTKYVAMAKSTSTRDWIQLAFILQERAASDGYLLPAYVLPNLTTGEVVVTNYAIVGDTMYLVSAEDDSVVRFFTLLYVQPTRPEPMP